MTSKAVQRGGAGERERLEDQIAALEVTLRGDIAELRKLLLARKRRATKRRGTVAERSAALAEREPSEYQPTELQRARARRALGLR